MTAKMSAVATALVDYSRGDTRGIDFLLNQLRSQNGLHGKNVTFISECLDCVDQIPENIASILFSIFLDEIHWYTLSSSDQDNCLSLLILLITMFPNFLSIFLKSVCKLLLKPSLLQLPNQPSVGDIPSVGFQHFCQAIRELLSVLPQSESSLVESLKSFLPGWRRPSCELFVAFSNLLELCTTQLLSIDSICLLFDVIFINLIELGSNYVVNGKIEAEILAPLSSPSLLEVEHLQSTKKLFISALSTENTTVGENCKEELILWLIIMSFKKMFPSRKMEKLKRDYLVVIFKVLRKHFFQSVLPVKSKFKAFALLLTFVCSLHSGIVVSFVESLWNFIKDTRQPCEARVRCVHYLTDYMTRAEHCPCEALLEQLHDMASWCVEYTYFRRSRLPSTFAQMLVEHKLFYTVFEGIVYLLTYRQQELIGSKTHRDSCSLLPLSQLINCPFHPLDGLSETLKIGFLSTTSAYKLSWSAFTLQSSKLAVDELVSPVPSFSCPLSDAEKIITFAPRLGLLIEFSVAKRVTKLMAKRQAKLCNGIGIDPVAPTKQKKRKKQFFDFNALANLQK